MVIRNPLIMATAAISALLVVSGCGGVRATEEFYQSYQVRSGTTIEIYNSNGDVTITGWDQSNVEIFALKESFRGQPALDEVEIFIDIADRMVILTEHPDQSTDVTVSYEIKVPEDIFVEVIDCSNGNIKLEDVTGNAALSTSNGSVSVSNVNGIVSARSSNGNITAAGVKGLGGLRTSNGSIEAELPALHEAIEIRTSNGSITLSLLSSLEADLEASTSNGTVSVSNLNVDIVELSQTMLVGMLNGGGHKISITTSNGSIDLLQLR